MYQFDIYPYVLKLIKQVGVNKRQKKILTNQKSNWSLPLYLHRKHAIKNNPTSEFQLVQLVKYLMVE